MKYILFAILISAIVQIIWFAKNTKPKKVTRSQEAFESVAKKQCICDNPCNEFCRK